MISSREYQVTLHSTLWSMADELRAHGQMQADDFKDLLLGIIFFRYASERVEQKAADILGNALSYAQSWHNETARKHLSGEFLRTLGYVISPSHLFNTLAHAAQNLLKAPHDEKVFALSDLTDAFTEFEQSTEGGECASAFTHLFEDVDLSSHKLGRRTEDRSVLVAKVIVLVDQMNLAMNDNSGDVLGDVYEYLIGKFSSGGGQNIGEFYTPQSVAELLAKIVTAHRKELTSV